MPLSRLFGLVLLAGGLIVLGIGIQQSDSVGDQAKHFFTGDYRDKTVWMIVIGSVAALVGVIGIGLPARANAA